MIADKATKTFQHSRLFFTFFKFFKLFSGFQPGIVGQTVSPTPVLPPGAFASTPPEGVPGQPGFGGLEGEDSLQGASLPDDEFLVSFLKDNFIYSDYLKGFFGFDALVSVTRFDQNLILRLFYS